MIILRVARGNSWDRTASKPVTERGSMVFQSVGGNSTNGRSLRSDPYSYSDTMTADSTNQETLSIKKEEFISV